jgi:hypothetical protein
VFLASAKMDGFQCRAPSYRLLIRDDWRLRWHHYFQGPFLLRRGRYLHKSKELELVQDYYKGHKTKEELTGSGTPLNDLETNTLSGTATMERVECPNCDSQRESGPERVLKGNGTSGKPSLLSSNEHSSTEST